MRFHVGRLRCPRIWLSAFLLFSGFLAAYLLFRPVRMTKFRNTVNYGTIYGGTRICLLFKQIQDNWQNRKNLTMSGFSAMSVSCDEGRFRAALNMGLLNKRTDRLQSLASELFNYLESQFNQQNLPSSLNSILDEVSQMELTELNKAAGIQDWRTNESQELQKLVQTKIARLQNPEDLDKCLTSPRRLCKLNIPAGFAAGIHELLWCLIASYHTNQTLLLDDTNWAYKNESWTELFLPLSGTCEKKHAPREKLISEQNITIDETHNDPVSRQLLNFFPKLLGERIISLTSEPIEWWYGQFIGYIIRPNKRLKNHIEKHMQAIGYRQVIVGVHVRRTDKIEFEEAAYHSVDDYMVHVIDFYNKQELERGRLSPENKLVYVATDDPSVLTEFRNKYKNFKFIGSQSNAELAMNSRYSKSSLLGVITDVFLLAESDYIICTFSSGVCRLAYALMFYLRPETTLSVHSLDVPFHYDYAYNPPRVAMYHHHSRSDDEWELKPGDVIYEREAGNGLDWWSQAFKRNVWSGYYYGSNYNQTSHKLYPLYKTTEQHVLI